jgi:hypothetical protein
MTFTDPGLEDNVTQFETTPEGWVTVTLTGDEEFPVRPWHAEQASGPPYPEYWVDCPACKGDGCGYCDGIGRRHPKPATWVDDELQGYRDLLSDLNHRLENPTFPRQSRRATEWLIVAAEVAEELMDRWHREDAIDGEGPASVAASPDPQELADQHPSRRPSPHGITFRTIWGPKRAVHGALRSETERDSWDNLASSD